jgi:glycosyltransferase involved in cell wall biosynthesis
MHQTLYLTRNGLLEPLGQSQVLAYLRGLSRDHRITLITREKTEDWADEAAVTQLRAECAGLGIDWRPRPFRPRPRFLAPALDLISMTYEVWQAARGGQAQLVHARSYIPAAVAWTVWRIAGVPFIFDMRALWPEELITAGRLRRGSWLHRQIAGVERVCLRDAAGVVSLTQAALAHLQKVYPTEMAGQRVAIIPTCADLDRFVPRQTRSPAPRVYGCIGTVLSGWFRLDWLAAFIAAAAERDGAARFDIVTRDDATKVREALDPDGSLGARLIIGPRVPADMPSAVAGHDISVMFFTDGLSKLGSSPTRMAEVLGTAIPVVANAGVGDVAQIVEDHRVGVLATGPQTMVQTLDELDRLLDDPDLPARCRAAAEVVFSLDAGTRDYRALYAEILDHRPQESLR